MAFSQRVRNDNPASFGVGTAQGQQLNVMAASLLDQNSRSLFHKQRVRAFFSPNFFDAADPALRRLDGWSAEPQRTLGREFLGRFSVLSDVAPDCVPTANYFVPPLNLSLPLLPQIPTRYPGIGPLRGLQPRSIRPNSLRSLKSNRHNLR